MEISIENNLKLEGEKDLTHFCEMYEFLIKDSNAYNAVRFAEFENHSPMTISKYFVPDQKNLRFDYILLYDGNHEVITGSDLRRMYEDACERIGRNPCKDENDEQLRRLHTCQEK